MGVLVFHQLGFYISNELKFTKVPLYNTRGVAPFGVPAILSAAFWGGLWGIAAAFVVLRLRGVLAGPLGWILFAAVVVTLVNWFVVFPLKGQPVGNGFRMPGVVVVPLVYALWGFGMWLIATPPAPRHQIGRGARRRAEQELLAEMDKAGVDRAVARLMWPRQCRAAAIRWTTASHGGRGKY